MNVKNIPDLLSYGGEGKLIVNRDFKYSSNRACVILLGETIVVERPSIDLLSKKTFQMLKQYISLWVKYI